MNISFQKQWVFGQFLIFADSRFEAKRAYEILKNNEESTERFGKIQLNDGKKIHWTNVAYRPDYRFTSRRIRSF